MEEYKIIWWTINESYNSPLGTDKYYPLMKAILKNNGFIEEPFDKSTALSYFNYIIGKTCKEITMFSYYHQTLLVAETFKKEYEKDKDNAMNMKTEDFIKLLKESD